MDSIKFGANLFEKAIEMQTKTVRACDVIVKIDEELSTMPEPFKMDFICLVTRAVDKCKNMNDKETEDKVTKALLEQTRWIPCNEKLPEEGRSVLICINDGSKCGIYVSYRMIHDIWEGHGRLNEDTVAWMPLPKPYEEVVRCQR